MNQLFVLTKRLIFLNAADFTLKLGTLLQVMNMYYGLKLKSTQMWAVLQRHFNVKPTYSSVIIILYLPLHY